MKHVVFPEYQGFLPNLNPYDIANRAFNKDPKDNLFMVRPICSMVTGIPDLDNLEVTPKAYFEWYLDFYRNYNYIMGALEQSKKENLQMIDFFHKKKSILIKYLKKAVYYIPKDESSQKYIDKLLRIRSILQELLEMGIYFFNLNTYKHGEFHNDDRSLIEHLKAGIQRGDF
jgi:hypothetical protein